MLRCLMLHFASKSLFILFDCGEHTVDLKASVSTLRDFTLHDHPLLLKLLLDSYIQLFEISLNHRDTLRRILIHQYIQDPGLTTFYSSPIHRDLIIRRQTVI